MTSHWGAAGADDVGAGCLKAGLWYVAFLDFSSACAFMGKAQLERADSQHRLALGLGLDGKLALEEFESGGMYL